MDAKQRVGVLGGREVDVQGGCLARYVQAQAKRPANLYAFAFVFVYAGDAANSGWAQEALGPLASEQEDAAAAARRSRSLAALERKCADLAARAQRRLQVSAALRSTSGLLQPRPGTSPLPLAPSSSPTPPASPAWTRSTQWAEAERHRNAAYAGASLQGQQERRGQGLGPAAGGYASDGGAASVSHGLGPGSGAGQGAGQRAVGVQLLKSHTLLGEMMAQAAAEGRGRAGSGGHQPLPAAGENGQGQDGGLAPSPSPAAATVPGPLSGLKGRAGQLHRVSSGRGALDSRVVDTPLTAADGPPGAGLQLRRGPATRPASAHAGGMAGGRAAWQGGSAGEAGRMRQLQEEIDSLKEQLEEARGNVQSQSELEGQLRETIDLLRGRVHAQTSRELESMRRLQQHARLEPLFDKLAESFVFNSPEEVIARLELLEDDKLGTFDQLLRTQEEVAALQSQLAAAREREQQQRTALNTQHLSASAQLQARNAALEAEVEEMEVRVGVTEMGKEGRIARIRKLASLSNQHAPARVLRLSSPFVSSCHKKWIASVSGLSSHFVNFCHLSLYPPRPLAPPPPPAPQSLNRRLQERQSTLVSLQTAVLDLWGRCQDDPAFLKANAAAYSVPSAPGSAAAVPGGGVWGALGGGGAGASLNLQAILASIQEYLIAKTPHQSSRHYLAVQQLANKVWLQHFQHKQELRGKVVNTFDALSQLADIMANKIRSTQEQLEHSKGMQQDLTHSLRKLEVQKRALQAQLERRDALVRGLSGVPRAQRPLSASTYLTMAITDQVPSQSPTQQPPHSPARPASAQPARRPTPTASAAVGADLAGNSQHTDSSSNGRTQQPGKTAQGKAAGSVRATRPSSAPSARSGTLHKAQGAWMEGAAGRCEDPGSVSQAVAGGSQVTLTPRSLVRAGGGPAQSGALYTIHATAMDASEPDERPSAGRSSGSTQASKAGVIPDEAVGSGKGQQPATRPRWTPPQRSAIESQFLQRLTRAASGSLR
ncbi:hypothetical protein QJQ45_018551 [Haematococcus lacustris]|nr:hypothetical protein QJQ45_018551 [Haematococcus lacustris]